MGQVRNRELENDTQVDNGFGLLQSRLRGLWARKRKGKTVKEGRKGRE